jgi:hypothetical protein
MALLVVAFAPLGLAGAGSVGIVTGAVHATVNGHELLPNTTLFAGDSVHVGNGIVALALREGSRLLLGRDTTASFQAPPPQSTTISLERGRVSLYYAQGAPSLRVVAYGLSIVSTGEFPTLGEVSLLDGTVFVRANDGHLRVEGQGSPVEVIQGKTLVVQIRAARRQIPGTAAHGAQAGPHLGARAMLKIIGLATGAVSAELSAVTMVRIGDAKDAANSADAAARNVITAADAAAASAEQAEAGAVAVGCAINTIAGGFAVPQISPFVPPAGFTCP